MYISSKKVFVSYILILALFGIGLIGLCSAAATVPVHDDVTAVETAPDLAAYLDAVVKIPPIKKDTTKFQTDLLASMNARFDKEGDKCAALSTMGKTLLTETAHTVKQVELAINQFFSQPSIAPHVSESFFANLDKVEPSVLKSNTVVEVQNGTKVPMLQVFVTLKPKGTAVVPTYDILVSHLANNVTFKVPRSFNHDSVKKLYMSAADAEKLINGGSDNFVKSSYMIFKYRTDASQGYSSVDDHVLDHEPLTITTDTVMNYDPANITLPFLLGFKIKIGSITVDGLATYNPLTKNPKITKDGNNLLLALLEFGRAKDVVSQVGKILIPEDPSMPQANKDKYKSAMESFVNFVWTYCEQHLIKTKDMEISYSPSAADNKLIVAKSIGGYSVSLAVLNYTTSDSATFIDLLEFVGLNKYSELLGKIKSDGTLTAEQRHLAECLDDGASWVSNFDSNTTGLNATFVNDKNALLAELTIRRNDTGEIVFQYFPENHNNVAKNGTIEYIDYLMRVMTDDQIKQKKFESIYNSLKTIKAAGTKDKDAFYTSWNRYGYTDSATQVNKQIERADTVQKFTNLKPFRNQFVAEDLARKHSHDDDDDDKKDGSNSGTALSASVFLTVTSMLGLTFGSFLLNIA